LLKREVVDLGTHRSVSIERLRRTLRRYAISEGLQCLAFLTRKDKIETQFLPGRLMLRQSNRGNDERIH